MIYSMLLASAVAKPPMVPGHETPPHVEFWRGKVDWNIAQHEAVGRLAEYVAIDTRNPPGNESAGADFVASVLEREGIEVSKVELTPGRSSLIARVGGVAADTPMCLMHHIDTVGFDEEAWTNTFAHGPLSGAQSEGFVWGRGALDAKGLGIVEVMTLVWLKRLKVPLLRDVVLIAVADGEVDHAGAEQLAEMWGEIGCSHLINEGGMGIQDAYFEGQAVHTIWTSEKGTLWVDVHADGQGGDGSLLYPDQAPQRLVDAMNALATFKAKVKLQPEVASLLYAVGEHKGGGAGRGYKSGFWMKLGPWGQLMRDPAIAATASNTLHLTGVRGGGAPNVVPERLTASYDARLLPGTEPEAFLAELQELVEDVEGVSLEVRSQRVSRGSPLDDLLLVAMAHYATEERPDAVAGPFLAPGLSDALILRPTGVKAYGYVPFEVSAEIAASAHGPDERVPVDEVREGLRRMFSIVLDFAGNP